MMDRKATRWLEVWIESSSLSYLLILYLNENGKFVIVDPQKEFDLVIQFSTYEEARIWLNEDEYDLIETRYNVEELYR